MARRISSCRKLDPCRRHRHQAVPLRRRQRRDTTRDEAVDQPSVQGGRYDGELLQCFLGGRIDGPGPGRVPRRRWSAAGCTASPAAMTSVTKNGLPDVTAYTWRASRALAALNCRTASADSRASGSRRTRSLRGR